MADLTERMQRLRLPKQRLCFELAPGAVSSELKCQLNCTILALHHLLDTIFLHQSIDVHISLRSGLLYRRLQLDSEISFRDTLKYQKVSQHVHRPDLCSTIDSSRSAGRVSPVHYNPELP